MKLWADSESAGSAGRVVRAKVSEMVEGINQKVVSRGVRAVNALRNAELEVLKGQRSGKVYRKPYTKKATYTASAPGEAPARRTGNLRMHWDGQVKRGSSSRKGVAVIAGLESKEKYAGVLEDGAPNMASRPFVGKIIEKAKPEIQRIYREPYT